MTINTLYDAFLQCSTVCTDTRKINSNCMFFALKGDNFNGNEFADEALKKGARFVVVDEKKYATNSNSLLVDDVLESLQQMATHHRKILNTPIISLTGSNGKTTTKELINSVLSSTYKTCATKGNLNNHIGVPLTLLELDNTTEIGIVEMGANHQKEIEFLTHIALPDYGLITNFGKAHLEGFGSIEGVINGKSELYDYLKKNHKTIFVNHHDVTQLKQVGHYENSVLFGSNVTLLSAQPYVVVEFNDLKVNTNLTGAYNYNNIAVAIALGQYFKIDDKTIAKAIENYIPSNNRSQILEKGSNRIILDAYNANPTSMKAALDNFSNLESKIKVAILGDMFELGREAKKEHQYISDYTSKLEIDTIYLVGENFFFTKNNSENILLFKSFEELKSELVLNPLKHKSVLIKGSRGMALERVLNLL